MIRVLGSLSERWRMLVLGALGVVAAVGMTHGVMFLSGFRLGQGGLDARQSHLVIEHEYRWLRGDSEDKRLWDMPVYYPVRGTLAHGDVLLSYAPPYAAARALGLAPDSAYQAWLIFVAVANMVCALLFFRRVAGAPPIAATMGALLFCVVAPRVNQFGHPQLYPQVFLLVATAALVRVVRDGRPDGPTITAWPLLAALAAALQAWGGYYLTFFMCLALLLGMVAAMATRSARVAMMNPIRRLWASLLVGVAVFAILVAPLAIQYFRVLVQAGRFPYASVEALLPRLQSWFYPGASYAWGWMGHLAIFRRLPSGEHVMGFGFLTLCVAFAGFWVRRRTPLARWLALAAALVVAVSTVVHGYSLWQVVYTLVPGANAIRAVARIWLILVLPLALAVSAALAHLERQGNALGALLLGVACIAEQSYPKVVYDKVQFRAEVDKIVRAIPPSAQTFFVSVPAADWDPRPHVDAMWAAMTTRLPTINGYLGTGPRGYDLVAVARTGSELAEVERRLARWCERNGIDASHVAWIHDGYLRPFYSRTYTCVRPQGPRALLCSSAVIEATSRHAPRRLSTQRLARSPCRSEQKSFLVVSGEGHHSACQ